LWSSDIAAEVVPKSFERTARVGGGKALTAAQRGISNRENEMKPRRSRPGGKTGRD
jgi:hypothetical protein